MKRIEQTSGFSTQRFLQVTKRLWVLNQKKWLIGFAGGLGILLLIYLFRKFGGMASSTNTIERFAILGVGLTLYKFGGYFLTSGIFNELGKKSSASQMLTLPASTLEKFAAGWVLTYFLYSIVVVGLLYIIGIILGIIPILTTQQLSDSFVNNINIYFLSTLISYSVFHSIFFLGSIYFDGSNFLKTLNAIIISLITIGTITFIFFTLYPTEPNKVFFSSFYVMELGNSKILIAGTLVKLGIAALFLFFSYRQLQNRQIT